MATFLEMKNKQAINNKHKKTPQSSEEIIKLMLDNAAVGISIISPKLEMIWLNKTLKKWFPDIDIRKKSVCFQCFYTSSKKKMREYCPTIKTLKTGKIHYSETGTCSNGRIYSITSTAVKNNHGKVSYAVETVEDITERKIARQALEDSEKQYRTLVENVNIGVYRNTGGTHGRFIQANPAIAKMFGYNSVEEFKKIAVSDLYQDPEDRRLFIEQVLQKGYVQDKELRLRKKDGTPIWCSCTAKAQYDDKGHIKWIDGVIEDITERKQTERKLQTLNTELLKSSRRFEQLALRDSHTGLYNHRYLAEAIEREFARVKRYNLSLSVVMLDLDYFKSINDVYGHQFGDLILKQFAYQLKRMVRRYDIVVRYGGEEFIIIFPGTDRQTATTLAKRILDAINLYNFGNEKHTIKIKVSLGVASYPEDKIAKGVDLVDFADKVLNKVKEDGGNRAYSSLDIKKERSPASLKIEETADIQQLKEKIEKLTKRANQSLMEAVFAFAKTIKLKDHYTGEHVESSVQYATEIGRTLNLSKEELERVRQAAILHDLGKIGISEKILLKRTRLTDREFTEIKKHPQIASDIIRPIQFLQSIIPFILYHHERWDGRGYLSGLEGKDIPLGARIIAIADIYQALISKRPYRNAYTKEKAIRIIEKGANTQFDPKVVDAFLKVTQHER